MAEKKAKGASKEAKDTEEDFEQSVHFEETYGYPEVFEHLHNLIQDAQASGAIVQIVTIFPTSSHTGTGSEFEPKGCKPGAANCPKGVR